jgi:hypothetical protein
MDIIWQFLQVDVAALAMERIASYVLYQYMLDGQTVLFIFENCRLQEYCSTENRDVPRAVNSISISGLLGHALMQLELIVLIFDSFPLLQKSTGQRGQLPSNQNALSMLVCCAQSPIIGRCRQMVLPLEVVWVP